MNEIIKKYFLLCSILLCCAQNAICQNFGENIRHLNVKNYAILPSSSVSRIDKGKVIDTARNMFGDYAVYKFKNNAWLLASRKNSAYLDEDFIIPQSVYYFDEKFQSLKCILTDVYPPNEYDVVFPYYGKLLVIDERMSKPSPRPSTGFYVIDPNTMKVERSVVVNTEAYIVDVTLNTGRLCFIVQPCGFSYNWLWPIHHIIPFKNLNKWIKTAKGHKIVYQYDEKLNLLNTTELSTSDN